MKKKNRTRRCGLRIMDDVWRVRIKVEHFIRQKKMPFIKMGML
jgi:hypothetical protein